MVRRIGDIAGQRGPQGQRLRGSLTIGDRNPMSDKADVCSAADAVRYLYLARVAEREGHEEAARRWHAKAAGWLSKHFPGQKMKDEG